jgi:RNA polymerase sigma-70 factor, ECF subfamily
VDVRGKAAVRQRTLFPVAGASTADEALVARVAQGDEGAFALLYDRYARRVYALAAHMLGVAAAEEVVQEVFLSLWRNAAQFDARRASFEAWFTAVARNRVLDELRRRRREGVVRTVDPVEELLAQAPDPSADPEEEASQRERGTALIEALRSLPAEQRRVLVLAYFGGLTQLAIAEALGWPLGTVKKRVRLGLRKLLAAEGSRKNATT